MASNNDCMEGGVAFKWSDNIEYEKVLAELCIKFIRKNGRVSFRWKEINQQFESIIKRKCHFKTLKNKYDAMKRDWRIWRFLKFGETGLGWDPVTGKLSCSDEWWDRKIKEKPEAKKFRNKAIDPSLEELWNQLFEDNYADGLENVAPSMDPNCVQPVEHVNLNVNVEEEDKGSDREDMNHYESDAENAYAEYNRHDPRYSNLFNNDNSFWPDFMEGTSSTQVPTQGARATQVSTEANEGTQVPTTGVGVTQVASQGNGNKKTTYPSKVANKTVREKRKRRQSGGAAKLSNQIDALVSNSIIAVDILHSDDSSDKNGSANSTIAAAVTVINRMVAESFLKKGSELWCFALALIENEVRRDIFMNIEDDGGKKDWLVYMQANQK
ncbi:hypothetical protein L195_g013723 [Trifolium pratense]|uniref:Myb/SANT-like domain-containing protein n=1 Tax=Trifolium pratense TaxID=57577 RepID=A0A2K3PNX5_TRIPR|nr:uncharacterized protein LOC123922324 [Trifolium pratense]PNY16990.1 hypothetical protein L195_g013723 [Trifolium pratense]